MLAHLTGKLLPAHGRDWTGLAGAAGAVPGQVAYAELLGAAPAALFYGTGCLTAAVTTQVGASGTR